MSTERESLSESWVLWGGWLFAASATLLLCPDLGQQGHPLLGGCKFGKKAIALVGVGVLVRETGQEKLLLARGSWRVTGNQALRGDFCSLL